MPTTRTCSQHPGALAAWRCTGCERVLCPGCVGTKRLGATELHLCIHCGEVADVLLVRREEGRSYASRLPGALGYPLNPTGLITMLAAGLVMYVLGFMGGWGAAIALAIVWAYVFSLARASAMGSADIDPPDFTGFWDFFRPMRRACCAILVAWLPAILFVIVLAFAVTPKKMKIQVVGPELPTGVGVLTGEMPMPDDDGKFVSPDSVSLDQLSPEQRAQYDAIAKATGTKPRLRTYTLAEEEPLALRAVRNPLFWLFLLLGFFLGPMALAVAVADGGYLEILNPKLLVGAIRKFPRSYLLLSGSLMAIVVAQGVVELFTAVFSRLPIPFIPGILGATIEMYLPLVAARVIGLYLFVHGAELGYLPEQDAWEPAVPNPVPRAVLPESFAPAPVDEPLIRDGEPVATAGLLGAAATWQPSARSVELPPAPEGTAEPGAYTRPTEITLDDEDEPLAAPVPQAPPRQRIRELDPTSLDARAFDFIDEPEPAPPRNPLAAALAARDFAQALALYRAASPEVAASVGCDGLFELGRQAATEADFPAAVRALKAAAQADPSSPTAPKALVVMARVLGERMGDAASAAKVYAHVVRVYPGTEAAKFAAARLAPAS